MNRSKAQKMNWFWHHNLNYSVKSLIVVKIKKWVCLIYFYATAGFNIAFKGDDNNNAILRVNA